MTTWSEFKKRKKYPKLSKDITADVAIIGGGLAGILCAYMLSEAGKKVVLLEADELLSGATMYTTAFITKVIDTSLSELISIWGKEAAKKVFESGQAAVEEFERIIQKEGIPSEFLRVDNFLFASTARQFENIKDEAAAYKKLKIPLTLHEKNDLPFRNHGYLKIPRQAKFHVAKFAYELAERAALSGALIFEHTKVKELQEGQPMILETNHGTVRASDVIIATYQPLTNKKTHLKKGMYASYVFEAHIPKGLFPEAIYEDDGNPYHYFRVDAGDRYDTLIVGGEDHREELRKGLAKKSEQALEKYLSKLMDGHPYDIAKKWSGPVLEPSDGLALIGEIAPHLYVATAFSGNGMTYSMISALLLRDLIMGTMNPWKKVYDPKRTLLHPKRLAVKAKDYAEEFFRGAVKNLLSA